MTRSRALSLAVAGSVLLGLAAAGSGACYSSLSVGGFHGLVLAANTSVGFGENGAGQLDVPSSLAGLTVAAAAGGFFSCALHRASAGSTSMTVSCWGGNGGSAATSVPSAVSSDGGVRGLAAGGYHACAVLGDASAVCWGANGAGQVSPLPAAAASGVALLSLGSYHSCLTKQSSGSVTCWGRDDQLQVSGLPSSLAAGAGADTRLACGGYHCCGWSGSVGLTCWGASSAGQTAVPASVAAAASAGTLSAACAGGYFSCAVASGSVTCWGSNTKGETAVPAAARDGSVASVACGWYGACALRASGSLVCWGGSLGVAAAKTAVSSDVALATADLAATSAATFNTSGAVFVSSGSATAVSSGTSGAVSVTTGAAAGASGAIVLQTGAASSSADRGAISLLSPRVVVNGSMTVSGGDGLSLAGNLVMGSTTLAEADLAALLALIRTPSPTPSPSASQTPSATASTTRSPSSSLSGSPSATMTSTNAPSCALTTSDWYSKMSLGTLFGTSPAWQYAPDPDTKLQLGFGTFDVLNGVYRDQDLFAHSSFSVSFEAYIASSSTADGGFLVLGASGLSSTNINASEACGGLFYCLTLNVYTLGGRARGIYLMYNGTNLGFYSVNIADNTWRALSLSFDRAAATHFTVNMNGSPIIQYSDPLLDSRLAGIGGQWLIGWRNGAATGVFYVRRVAVTCGLPSSPTPTPSGTPSSTASVSASPSTTGSRTPSSSVSPSASITPTPTLTATGSPSPTVSASITPNRPLSWTVSTVAGGTWGWDDSSGTSARFRYPNSITFDLSKTILYFTEERNHLVRAVDIATRAVSTLAGFTALMDALGPTAGYADGTGTAAKLNSPSGIAVFPDGNIVVSDTGNQRLRHIDVATAAVTTLAGSGTASSTDGPAATASFNGPYGIAVDSSSRVFVIERDSNRIRVLYQGVVSTLAGSTSGTSGFVDGAAPLFNMPLGAKLSSDEKSLLVADGYNGAIRKVDATTGNTTTLVSGSSVGLFIPYDMALDPAGNLIILSTHAYLVVKVTPSGEASTVAGNGGHDLNNGPGLSSSFWYPRGIVCTTSGSTLCYIADTQNNAIRLLSLA